MYEIIWRKRPLTEIVWGRKYCTDVNSRSEGDCARTYEDLTKDGTKARKADGEEGHPEGEYTETGVIFQRQETRSVILGGF